MNIKLPDGEFDAYIFDCDGTLADTMPLHYRAWCAALKEHNAEFPEALFYELGGVPTARIVEDPDERRRVMRHIIETAWHGQNLEAMVAYSPLIEVTLDDAA